MKRIVTGVVCALGVMSTAGCQMTVTEDGVVLTPTPVAVAATARFEPSRDCRVATMALGPYVPGADDPSPVLPSIPNPRRSWSGWSLEPLDGTFVAIEKTTYSEQLVLSLRHSASDPARLESVQFWPVDRRFESPRYLRCVFWEERSSAWRRTYRCSLPRRDSDREGDRWAVRSVVVTRPGTRAHYGPRFFDRRCDGTHADRWFERDHVRLHGAVAPTLNVEDFGRRFPVLTVGFER
jgi:hypothetical protein